MVKKYCLTLIIALLFVVGVGVGAVVMSARAETFNQPNPLARTPVIYYFIAKLRISSEYA